MGDAGRNIPVPDGLVISRQLNGTPEAVSDCLCNIRDTLSRQGHPAARDGRWEMVMAEVLNNIVEHAYAEDEGGQICLILRFAADRMRGAIRDHGKAMPGLEMPEGRPAKLGGDIQDLPEGGFGWNIIRTLTNRLEYRRGAGTNNLVLEVPLSG